MIRTKDFHFLIMAVVVVGLLTVLYVTGRPRYLSRTEPHLKAASDAECFTCHGDGTGFPMDNQHPLRKKNCRQCHRLEKTKG